MDILLQALAVADKVIIAIGTHASKAGMFSYEERKQLIEAVIGEHGDGLKQRVSVTSFNNLVVDAATDAGASLLIRGLRDGSDLDYEMQMAGMNGAMSPGIQTVFLPSSPESRPITATLVRQIAKMSGDVSHFVAQPVVDALVAKANAS